MLGSLGAQGVTPGNFFAVHTTENGRKRSGRMLFGRFRLNLLVYGKSSDANELNEKKLCF